MSARTPIPYFSQFASRELVNNFLANPSTTGSDPRWHESGWHDTEEYVFWAWQTCGVAGLRSVLAMKGHRPTAATLTRDLLAFGAYVPDGARETVSGLIYAPFTTYISSHYGLSSHVRANLPVETLQEELSKPDRVVMVSVHPTIRDASENNSLIATRRPGGHLILAFDANPHTIRFHNPSGYWPDTQSDVELPWVQFAQFYARRGIIIQI